MVVALTFFYCMKRSFMGHYKPLYLWSKCFPEIFQDTVFLLTFFSSFQQFCSSHLDISELHFLPVFEVQSDVALGQTVAYWKKPAFLKYIITLADWIFEHAINLQYSFTMGIVSASTHTLQIWFWNHGNRPRAPSVNYLPVWRVLLLSLSVSELLYAAVLSLLSKILFSCLRTVHEILLERPFFNLI